MHATEADALTLAFDTSGPYCAAALTSGERVVKAQHIAMKRGQSEHLFPFLEQLLSETKTGWTDLARIGVGIGPGNFTGIRIAVAAARGLSLSLGIPAIGVSSFEAARFGHAATSPVALPAPRDQVYYSAKDNAAELRDTRHAGDALGLPDPDTLAARIAHIASKTDRAAPPAPLYLRPADAAPSSDPPPRILDDA